ncbi:MAG TPA: MFS transporter [Burkholderiales bacterium]|nr:MFS transporter [Burkholderiales bacterium]
MAFYPVVLVTVLNHVAFKGSKVLISLFAIELGASPFTIGLLFAMYSVFPVFLSVHAGRVSDRFGSRPPMVFGACGLAAGLLLPALFPGLPALFFSATLIGLCYIFYVVSVQSLIGSFGEGADRTRYYSLFSLGIGLTSLAGPVTAGFAIEGLGHRGAYLLLAAFPALPALALLAVPGFLPGPRRHQGAHAGRGVGILLADAPLRRVLIVAGIMETGNELVNFLLPIYAHSIGLGASQIGLVMGGYGAALLAIRTAMPALARLSSEERVLAGSLLVAALVLLAFPFVRDFALLAALAFVLGLGLGCGSPISLVLAYNRSPAGRSGEAIGLRQTVNKTVEVLVPVAFGSLGTAFGMVPVFWLDALLLAAGALIMQRDARAQAARRGG